MTTATMSRGPIEGLNPFQKLFMGGTPCSSVDVGGAVKTGVSMLAILAVLAVATFLFAGFADSLIHSFNIWRFDM